MFIATGGNLAASFTASFVNQVVFSTLQRYSSARMRKRSAELALELADFNKMLRAIRDKNKEKAAAKIAALAPPVSPPLSCSPHPTPPRMPWSPLHSVSLLLLWPPFLSPPRWRCLGSL